MISPRFGRATGMRSRASSNDTQDCVSFTFVRRFPRPSRSPAARRSCRRRIQHSSSTTTSRANSCVQSQLTPRRTMKPEEYLRQILESQKLAEDSDALKRLRRRREEIEGRLREAYGSSPTIRYGGSQAKG